MKRTRAKAQAAASRFASKHFMLLTREYVAGRAGFVAGYMAGVRAASADKRRGKNETR